MTVGIGIGKTIVIKRNNMDNEIEKCEICRVLEDIVDELMPLPYNHGTESDIVDAIRESLKSHKDRVHKKVEKRS